MRLLLHDQVHGSLLFFRRLNILRCHCGLRPCEITQGNGLILAWFFALNNGIVQGWSIWIRLDAGELVFMVRVIFGLWFFHLFLLLTDYWFWLVRPDFVILCDEQCSRATLKSLNVVNRAFWLNSGSTSLVMDLFEHSFSNLAEVLLWVICIKLRQFSNVEVFQTLSATAENSVAICFIQTRQIRKFKTILCLHSIRKWKYLLIFMWNTRTDINHSLRTRQILHNVRLVKVRLLWIELLRNPIDDILWGQES